MHESEGGGASRTTDPATGSSTATDVSLREHLSAVFNERFVRLEARIDEVERSARDQVAATLRELEAAFAASEKAIAKAENATEKRFESVNEFRAQLTDQTATFMPREVYQAAHEQLIARVAALEKQAQFGEGRQKGIGVTTGVLVTIVTVSVAVLGIVVVLANYVSSH